jgi:hypothetical protein
MTSNLTRGNTSSCGCLHKEVFSAAGVAKLKELRDKGVRWVKHDMSGTHVYRVWASIKERCYRPGCRAFRNYGGRGIIMCDEWKNDFLAFYNYVGEPPSIYHSIDRIDNDGNYEPGNVRWATAKQQANNQRPRPPRPPKQPKPKKYRQIIR